MLIHNKDDIEFVAEFPCLLGHPIYKGLMDTVIDVTLFKLRVAENYLTVPVIRNKNHNKYCLQFFFNYQKIQNG